MVSWSGRRKTLTILLFIAPTLLGILVFNIYPILFNFYISFTNRNQFRPNPDCNFVLTRIIEPTCWGVFKFAPTGLGAPFRIQDPFYANYADLIGDLFSLPVLQALLVVVICLLPLYIASRVNARLERQIPRPVSSTFVWLAGLAVALLLAWVLDILQNYNTIMKAGDFIVVMFRTLLFVAICIPIFFIIGLILALILNNPRLPGKTFFRVILIVPWAASNVAIMMSLIWQFFFREQGTINQILSLVFNFKGPAWLNDQVWAFLVIVLVNVWYTYPFFMVTILGALQSIPQEQYEAAEVDGASWWNKLTNITLPLIRPAVLPTIVLTAIGPGGFQMFGTVWAITAGGPSRGAGTPGATELVMVYAYKQVVQTQAYGRMGAYAVIMFIFLFIMTLYSLRMTRITKGAYE